MFVSGEKKQVYRCEIYEDSSSLLWLGLVQYHLMRAMKEPMRTVNLTQVWNAVWSLYPCVAFPATDSFRLSEPSSAAISVEYDVESNEVTDLSIAYSPESEPGWRQLITECIQSSPVYCIYLCSEELNNTILNQEVPYHDSELCKILYNSLGGHGLQYLHSDTGLAKHGAEWLEVFGTPIETERYTYPVVYALRYDGVGFDTATPDAGFDTAFKAYAKKDALVLQLESLSTRVNELEEYVANLKIRLQEAYDNVAEGVDIKNEPDLESYGADAGAPTTPFAAEPVTVNRNNNSTEEAGGGDTKDTLNGAGADAGGGDAE